MKILALIGTPRKGGNTDILVDKLLEGAEKKEHVYEKIYLYRYNISSCKACNICKKDNYVCTMKDDMQKIYSKIDTADVIIFGTPNYWFGPSAKMKLLIDRLLPYTSNKNLEEKYGILIAAAADGPEACGPLLEMFRLSFEYLNMKFIGHVLGTAYEKKEIVNDKRSMSDAFNLGFSL